MDNIQTHSLTVSFLLEAGKISQDQLQEEIIESDLPSLAKFFDNPGYYVVQFGLSRSEQADVKKLAVSNTEDAMHKALQFWQRVNPLEATFNKLLTIVLSGRRGDIALEICKYLTEDRQQSFDSGT